MPADADAFQAVAEVARPIIERVVWCTVTTVGPDHAPRSRLMHPVWFWTTERLDALVTARPTPIKIRHLKANKMISCFYWDPSHDTVAIDATAEWLDPEDSALAWDRIKGVAAPVGFDPAIIWPDGPDNPDVGILRFSATRLVTKPAGRPALRTRLA